MRIVDGRTLLMADRKGNKRADSLHNLLQDDRLSFAALVPGRTGVLQVRGRGGSPSIPRTWNRWRCTERRRTPRCSSTSRPPSWS